MDNISIVEYDGVEYVIIDRGNDEYTSMTKARWDELEAAKEQSETL